MRACVWSVVSAWWCVGVRACGVAALCVWVGVPVYVCGVVLLVCVCVEFREGMCVCMCSDVVTMCTYVWIYRWMSVCVRLAKVEELWRSRRKVEGKEAIIPV